MRLFATNRTWCFTQWICNKEMRSGDDPLGVERKCAYDLALRMIVPSSLLQSFHATLSDRKVSITDITSRRG